MDLNNLKIIKKLKDVSPKLKLAFKNHMQDLKIKSRYIDFLIPEEEKDIMKDAQRIEDMVRETLVQEFSEKIKENKSYEMLVDAVVHNIKKKSLEDTEEI